MRGLNCLKLRSGFGSTIWLGLKIVVIVLLCLGILHMILKTKITTNSVIRTRNSADSGFLSSWSCELNKRMLQELQREIEEKDKLLKYRGKVIASLRTLVQDLNATNKVLTNTLTNLTEVLVAKNFSNNLMHENKQKDSFYLRSNEPTPFPPHLRDSVERPSRPCCLALKRMTDILRIYMETTQDLREQVAVFQSLNITEQINDLAEQEKKKFAVENCSSYFTNDVKNITKPEKYSLYQTFSNGYFYETFPWHKLEKQNSKSKSYHRNIDFQRAVNFTLKEILKVNKLPSKYFHVENAWMKYDEIHGVEYKISFLFNKTRSFLVEVVKPFGPQILRELTEEPFRQNKELINIIVPVSGRAQRLHEFLENIRIIAKSGENIFLTIVIYGADENDIKKTVKKFSVENNFKSYDILKKNVPFNRGRALHDGIQRWNGYKNVLMFFCDVDIKFDVSFLNRCRQQTVLGKSVYFPILFSLYNPKIVFNGENYSNSKYFEVSENNGIWRTLGYGMVCTYKPDYLAVHGFNLRIQGWGGEDVSLYYRYLKKNYKVIRAPDPNLFHVWHPKLCLKTLSKRQYETCIGSMARYEGSQRQLGILLFANSTINGW
ncbi:uncharacterized protein LOC100209345 isoform X3 [Hydra vulgaris]|uniref:Hexosyltransferase n=2 Tax=Hydra vulgaris TaxID=6087 RepID=A0ABM4CNT2_HYDVU